MVTNYDTKDSRRLEKYVSTNSFALKGFHPRRVAEEIGK